MSKFKRLSFSDNQKRFPLMNAEAQKAIKGGCSQCDDWLEQNPGGTIYTADDFYNHTGDWPGGFVCGVGNTLPGVDVYAYGNIVSYCNIHNLEETHGLFGDECFNCYFDGFSYCDYHTWNFSPHCYPCDEEDRAYGYGDDYGYGGSGGGSGGDSGGGNGGNSGSWHGGGSNNTETPDYNISFSGTTADSTTISAKTIGILEDIMDFTGDYSLTITSTARSIYDQARIMYENILSHGVQHQLDTYKTPGDNVVKVYDATLSREDNIAAMVTQIKQEGSTKVSKHCADHTVLNVFDIALSSIEDSTKFKQALDKFGIYHLDENGCIHLEIPQ